MHILDNKKCSGTAMWHKPNSCPWDVDARGLGSAGYPLLRIQLGTDWPWLRHYPKEIKIKT